MIWRYNNFQRLQLKHDKSSMYQLWICYNWIKLMVFGKGYLVPKPQHFVVVKPTESRLSLNTIDAFNSLTNRFAFDSFNFQCKRAAKHVSYLRSFNILSGGSDTRTTVMLTSHNQKSTKQMLSYHPFPLVYFSHRPSFASAIFIS